MDLGFGRMQRSGRRHFSEHYCACFVVLPKGFYTEGNRIREGKILPPAPIGFCEEITRSVPRGNQ